MRRDSPSLFATLLLLASTVAHAATSPPGVNMRWDQCYADGGAMYKTFACDTNAGSERLVLSLELDAPKPDVTGMEFIVSLETPGPTLPAWWVFRAPGSCRMASSSFQLLPPPGSANCVDWGAGQSGGGIGAYDVNPFDPVLPRARFRCAVAVPASMVLEAGTEYFIGSIAIDHQKTVGAGACAGCDVPVCLAFDQVTVTTSSVAGDVLLTRGANYEGSRIVGWQNGLTINYQPAHFAHGFHPATYDCVLYDITGSRQSTWGAVKSLYR